MSETVKTMLIIEDDERWKDTLEQLCRKSHQKLYGNAGNVIHVSGVDEALQAIRTQPIHFASVDLNLKGDPKGTKDPSGLELLKEIYTRKLNTVSIVVSGEYDPDFSALSKKYGVLTFQQKSKPTFAPTYITAVEAALRFVEAKTLLDEEKYKEALAKWQELQTVVKPIEGEGAEDWTYPVDIEEVYQNTFRHPVTHLPSSQLIEDEFSQLVTKESWLLLYLKIKHLAAFAASQGHMPEEALLRETKKVIEQELAAHHLQPAFTGQTSDNIFVVALDALPTPAGQMQTIPAFITNVKKRFDQDSLPHYDYATRERGHIDYKNREGKAQSSPFAALNIGLIKGHFDKFAVGQLSDNDELTFSAAEYGDIRDIDRTIRQALD